MDKEKMYISPDSADDCCRINKDKLSLFHLPLGHDKTESRLSEKDSKTDITSGDGETRTGK